MGHLKLAEMTIVATDTVTVEAEMTVRPTLLQAKSTFTDGPMSNNEATIIHINY